MSDDNLDPVKTEELQEETVPTAEAPAETAPAAAEAPAAEAPAAPAEEPAPAPAAEEPVHKPRTRAAKAAPVVAEAPAPPKVYVVDFGTEKEPVRGRRKTRTGRVVSSKMEKTVVVSVESSVRHPLYGKTIRRTTKFKAHDEGNICGEGDTVEIMETRPISREKRWRVVRIIEKAK